MLFPGRSVSININQNHSRYMNAIAKLLKRSLRYHHSCRGALSDTSQTPSCHVHGLLPTVGTTPRNSPSTREGQIFLSGILFWVTQLSSVAQTTL